MNQKQLCNELSTVFAKHDVHAAIVAVSFTEGEQVEAWGQTFVPVPPRDHEDDVLRYDAAKQASSLVITLTKNVYL